MEYMIIQDGSVKELEASDEKEALLNYFKGLLGDDRYDEGYVENFIAHLSTLKGKDLSKFIAEFLHFPLEDLYFQVFRRINGEYQQIL